MKRIALAASLLLVAAAIAGVARPEGAHAVDGTTATSSDSITVAGNGSVSGVPTSASFSFGVDVRAASAKAAIAANAREMRQVIAAVKSAGGRDVGTQSVSLSQVFTNNGEPSGFAASNVVTATIGLDKAGALIDAAVEAGANQVNGPTMSVADQGSLYRQALKAAMADARLSAETLAAAAGRSLGKVTTVVESGGTAPQPMFAKARRRQRARRSRPGRRRRRRRSPSPSRSARRSSREPRSPAAGRAGRRGTGCGASATRGTSRSGVLTRRAPTPRRAACVPRGCGTTSSSAC